MCFGDGQDNWHNELFIGGWSIPVASLYGDDPLLKRIDREIGSLDARTDMSTVTMGSRIVEPARIVEPVSNSFPNPERYEEERIRFEALWAATSDPERTYLALQALPLVERIAQTPTRPPPRSVDRRRGGPGLRSGHTPQSGTRGPARAVSSGTQPRSLKRH